jgi:putative phosphoribosyl transferase
MNNPFRNRIEAGQVLATRLKGYANREDVLVLALPRGGVPVAYAVAQRLQAPLDVMVVRKLGVPGHEELAMGALASGGGRVLNEEVIRSMQISPLEIEAATAGERAELARRELEYRDHRPPPLIAGQVVILVDDGLATGATMRAAVAAVRRQQPRRIIVAVPTAARDTCARLREEADDVVAVITPKPFSSVGEWYVDFSQTTDEEVRTLLRDAEKNLIKKAIRPAGTELKN